jgi:hypothetical protein
MRFFTPEWNTKRHAKRLKKVLKQHGRDLSYTKCLDLTAQLYGCAHFSELKNSTWDAPLSPFDEDVDDETLEARFHYQERVMAEAGLADIAGLVLDEVNPTGRGNRPAIFDDADEFADDAGSTPAVE